MSTPQRIRERLAEEDATPLRFGTRLLEALAALLRRWRERATMRKDGEG